MISFSNTVKRYPNGFEALKGVSLTIEKGDTLFLFTDGISETLDSRGIEYGRDRLSNLIGSSHSREPDAMIKACVDDLTNYRGTTPVLDDVTMMAIRWNGAE